MCVAGKFIKTLVSLLFSLLWEIVSKVHLFIFQSPNKPSQFLYNSRGAYPQNNILIEVLSIQEWEF